MLEIGRIVRIYFISSFGDLDQERAALERFVFPRLRELCQRHGFRFQAVDFRRGLTDETRFDDRATKRLLEGLCRQPAGFPAARFLVLLGDRYGRRGLPEEIPYSEYERIEASSGSEAVREILRARYRRDENAVPPVYVLQPPLEPGEARRLRSCFMRALGDIELSPAARAEYHASITERELVRGPLSSRAAARNTVAFIRDIENFAECVTALEGGSPAAKYLDLDEKGRFDAVAHQEITALKEAVAGQAGFCRRYIAAWRDSRVSADHLGSLPEGLDECLRLPESGRGKLCPDVFRELSARILADLERLGGDLELDTEVSLHHAIGARHARRFAARKTQLDTIMKYATSPGSAALWIRGGKGSGKSALLSRAVELICRDLPHAQVVVRFLGSTPGSSGIERLLRSLCQEICRRYGQNEDRVPLVRDELVPLLRRLMSLASKHTPLFLVLDGLDALPEQDRAQHPDWLPDRLPEHVRLLVSEGVHASSVRTFAGGAETGNRKLNLSPFDAGECLQLLTAWLLQEGRRLTSEQWPAVLQALEKRATPANLLVAFEQARHWRSYELPDELRIATGTTIAADVLDELEVAVGKPNVKKERRRSPRMALETCVNLASDSNFYTGFSEDISDGGVFVATYCLQPIGTSVELTFGLPGGHSVNAKGSVRWIRDIFDLDDQSCPGMGIGFEELSPEDKALIEQFMRNRSPIFFSDE